MRHKRKEFSAFSLSFLDIMSCGLGAFILLFIVANNSYQDDSVPDYDYLTTEIDKLDLQIAEISAQKEAMEAVARGEKVYCQKHKDGLAESEQPITRSRRDHKFEKCAKHRCTQPPAPSARTSRLTCYTESR